MLLEGSVEMRYLLAAIFVCAIGARAASALPSVGGGVSVTKSAPLVDVAKRAARAKSNAKAKKSQGLGGIHPLVGSGGY
jgi:hypothetical protein